MEKKTWPWWYPTRIASPLPSSRTNKVKAAPVKLSMQHLRGGKIRAVVMNSGNANACTGVRGIQDASNMAQETARRLGCVKNRVMVCSTGRIGVPLPLRKILKGIAKLSTKLTPGAGAPRPRPS